MIVAVTTGPKRGGGDTRLDAARCVCMCVFACHTAGRQAGKQAGIDVHG